jgi:regulator of protease activity HflC (stomatin/prohibitin superfamily)
MRKNTEIQRDEDAFSGQYKLGMKALVKSMQVAFFALAIVILGMLIYYFTFGGYFTVDPQEYVIVTRFGKYLGKYEDGWHWVFPYPINNIIYVPRTRQTFKTKAFMPDMRSSAFATGPDKRVPQSLVPGKDGYVVTGDENIMHTSWNVIYRIIEPEKYYLKCLCPDDPRDRDEVLKNPSTGDILGTRGPETLLKAVMNSVVLHISAVKNVDILYKNSSEFTDEVTTLFRDKVRSYDIGIEIDGIQLEASFPPAKTKPAFDDVIEAEQESSTLKEQAEKYKVEQLNRAESEAAEITAEAQTYKRRVVAGVMADEKYFTEILKEYKLNPRTMLVTLFANTLADSISSVKDKYILNSVRDGQKQEVRVKINPEPPAPQKRNDSK